MHVDLERSYLCRPEVVFSWLAESDRAKSWMKGISEIEITRSTPERTGTTFKEVLEQNGKSLEMTGAITEFEQDRSIGFHLESRIHTVDVRYAVEARGSSTRLIVKSTVRWKFPMSVLAGIVGGRIRNGMLTQLDSELADLRKLCEASAD